MTAKPTSSGNNGSKSSGSSFLDNWLAKRQGAAATTPNIPTPTASSTNANASPNAGSPFQPIATTVKPGQSTQSASVNNAANVTTSQTGQLNQSGQMGVMGQSTAPINGNYQSPSSMSSMGGQPLPPLPPLPNGVPQATQMPTINPTGQGAQGSGTEWSRQPSNNPNSYGGYSQPTTGAGGVQNRNAGQSQQGNDQEFTMSFH